MNAVGKFFAVVGGAIAGGVSISDIMSGGDAADIAAMVIGGVIHEVIAIGVTLI